MPLLSKVTVVVQPSVQPETPAPMTGEALPVFTRQLLDNPAKNKSAKITLVMQYDNPTAGMSDNPNPHQAEEHNTMTPQNIHGCHEVIRDWDWGIDRPVVVNSQPYTAFMNANNGAVYNAAVYRGVLKPDTVSIGGSQQTALNQFSEVLNGDSNKINALLSSTLGQQSFTYESYNILSIQLSTETVLLEKERIIHMWVMCGVAYCYTDHGKIYKSEDGFDQQSVLVGSVSNNVARMHPGIIENDPLMY